MPEPLTATINELSRMNLPPLKLDGEGKLDSMQLEHFHRTIAEWGKKVDLLLEERTVQLAVLTAELEAVQNQSRIIARATNPGDLLNRVTNDPITDFISFTAEAGHLYKVRYVSRAVGDGVQVNSAALTLQNDLGVNVPGFNGALIQTKSFTVGDYVSVSAEWLYQPGNAGQPIAGSYRWRIYVPSFSFSGTMDFYGGGGTEFYIEDMGLAP